MLPPIARHLPLLRQLEGYGRQSLRSDLVAGLTTAIMLIPQSMAYAMLAGLDPIVGLYAATVPLMVYGLLGTSRQLAVGPVAMDSLLVAAAVAPLAGDDAVRFAALATLLALMVGAIELAMGTARIGFIVKFLSQPVVAGFTSAAALVIGLSQLKYVLGVDLPRSRFIHEILLGAVQRADEIHWTTVALSVVAIASLLLLKRFAPRFPRFLFVVVGGTLAVHLLGLADRGVAIVGDVPAGLPRPALPALSLADLQALLPSAGLIAAVAFMESISVAKKYARDNHYDLDSNQELRALGLANIAGSLFSAYPVTGGFSRTAVNAAAGAKTNVASLITAGTVALTLLFLTPLFHDLPKAVLAAIIMSAVFGLIDIAQARHLWRISRPDLGAMALTFVATLTLGIGQGIVIGLVGSLLWFVWKTSKPHVAILGRLPGSTIYRNLARYPDARTTPGVRALRIDAPLYFANTAFLKDTVMDAVAGGDVAHLVIDCKAISSIDAQALATVEEMLDELDRRGVQLWLSGVRGPVRDALAAAGLTDRIGADHVVECVHDAVDLAVGPELAARPA